MLENDDPMASRTSLLSRMTAALKSFQQSSSKFRIIASIHPSDPSTPQPPVSKNDHSHNLFILDSSFNPPSIAHYTLARSAIESTTQPTRLLLLFATLNADKAASPASTPHRLALMTLLASDLSRDLKSSAAAPIIDIGLTTEPYYTDKSSAIESHGEEWYPASTTHSHLIGYDTFVRMFNPKYYPSHSPPLSALSPYFDQSGHRLRVTLRPDKEFGSEEEQRAFLTRLENGELEGEGAKREWAKQIELVQPNPMTGVSSTKIRKAAQEKDWETLEGLCTPAVAQWVRDEGLYSGDD